HVALLSAAGDHLRDFRGPLGMQLARLAFSADGKTLAVSGNDNVLFFIDLADGKRIDGDVFRARITDIEPSGDGFLVFHELGEKLHRAFITPGQRPMHRPDVAVKAEGSVSVADDKDVIVHDPELGARLMVRTEEFLLLPGVRGGSRDLIVNAEGF